MDFRAEETPYATPSNNEAEIYAEFKKLKIPTLPDFSLE